MEPLNNWEEIAGRSSYAAIIAQALYGESFSVTSGGNNKNSIGSLVNLSRETEQRFLTSMYADLALDNKILRDVIEKNFRARGQERDCIRDSGRI